MKVDIRECLGKTTSEAILNAKGGVLLPSGFTISQPIILALLKQGISTISIQEPNQDDESDAAMAMYIESLFIPFKTPLMDELKQCLIAIYR